ncbi:MAG: hypothetical protein Q8O35_00095 [Humidesulfovibrio sp.]|jgi:hypothetical protein|uniref:surface-adhesin E family protein n=1 Tax=Humidesulfovibrio sp. TaxID=2910988 RepID=UPI002733ADC8|nr:surface-adhesin E family protein [Humidesulfovibrio sp.]MDP2846570.1 hypothetical protein [Humidesulfovibrio sp.]
MRIYIFFLCILFVGPCHAVAADWAVIADTNKDTFILVDTTSIISKNIYVSFFAKTLFSDHDAKNISNKLKLKVTPKYLIEEDVANCGDKTMYTKNVYYYSKNGDTITSFRDNQNDFVRVLPESVGEAKLNFVCSIVQQK